MSKGFLWFAQNNDTTDYVKCSIALAKSIKQHNKENAICVVTDENSKFEGYKGAKCCMSTISTKLPNAIGTK